MPYELRDHTADVAVEAEGDSLSTLFVALADGLAAASATAIPNDIGDRFELEVVAESREALLFEYLDELIYLRDIRLELPVDNRIEALEYVDDPDDSVPASDVPADRWRLEASAHGVSLESIDAREIKAITYADMRLEETDSGWEAYVVFDV